MVFKSPRKSKESRLYKFDDADRAELERIEASAINDFKGTLDELESALGMLRLGHHVGWKVLYIVHSKKTIRKYEEILTGRSNSAVRVRDLFEPEGPSSHRSVGYRIVVGFSNFWKAIGGDAGGLNVENKRTVDR